MAFVDGGKLFLEFFKCFVNFFHLRSPSLPEPISD
jgi:hypothetical protein